MGEESKKKPISETKPADEKPDETKQTDEKPDETKQTDEKPDETKQTDEKPDETKQTDEKPEEEKQSEYDLIAAAVREVYDAINVPVKIRVDFCPDEVTEKKEKARGFEKRGISFNLTHTKDRDFAFLLDKEREEDFTVNCPWLIFSREKYDTDTGPLRFGLAPCRFEDQELVSREPFKEQFFKD